MRILLIFILASFSSFGQLPSNSMGATIVPIESKVLGYNYDLYVSLPDNYDSTQNYPVLYLLDAEWRIDITRSLVRELAINDQCPQHIIIGIPQIDWTHRLMNLSFTDTKIDARNNPDTSMTPAGTTGGGDKFLAFIENEVMPFVNENYSPNGFNVLMGHSLSGYYATYVMTKTDKFQAFQIFDPSTWYNASDVIHQLRTHLPEDYKATTFLGYAKGDEPLDAYFTLANDSLSLFLDEHQGIRSASRFYKNEYHNSMYMFGVIDGMKFLYEGYDFGFISPEDKITAQDYIDHFDAFSKKVNFKFYPKKDGFRWAGYANFTQENWDEAYKCYALCEDVFNSDTFFLNESAICYEALGLKNKALKNYERILTIEPENQEALKKVKLLKQK